MSKLGTRAELSLAFSLYSGPGTYTILLGSGISSAAGVLTGWNLPLDFVRQLATMQFRVIRGTLEVDHPYPVSDSSRYPDADRIQWVSEFVGHSVIANGCWQVLAAARAPEATSAGK